MKHNNVIGTNIYRRLGTLGMTQRALAEKIGVTEVTVSRYISGGRIPKGPLLVKMADVLKTTPEELCGEEITGSPREMFCRTRAIVKSFRGKWTNAEKLIIFLALMGWDDENEGVTVHE